MSKTQETRTSVTSNAMSSIKRRMDTAPESPQARRRTRQVRRRAPANAQKKRVTFEVDDNNRVRPHVRRIRKCLDINTPKGEQEAARLWWSKAELEGIMEREQNVFEVFSKCCTSYVDNVLKLWEDCEAHEQPTTDEVEKIANAPARGMENDLVVNFVPGSRQKAIQSVMKTQRSMAKAGFEARTTTMRRRYRHCSRAASEFAQKIANGDAQVAAAILSQ